MSASGKLKFTMPKTNTETRTAAGHTKIQLEPHQVVLRPLVTEKGVYAASTYNQYSFEVNRLATKSDIRSAIESLFDVKVLKVCTQNRKGKPRRYRFRYGRTKDWRKAVVTLHDESRIDFF